jgi:GT2 family glycosyltransferase
MRPVAADPGDAGSTGASVTICVATCGRPDQLAALLSALRELDVPDPFPSRMNILVVDNDPARSAEAVVARAAASSDVAIRYGSEPQRGVAVVRNALVALAGEVDFLAFIDDDEVPPPGWLGALLDAQAATDADVVAGPVLPRYEAGAPRWIRDGGFHRTPRILPAETTDLDEAWCGNALVRRAALRGREGPFPTDFGWSGGEDSVLFRAMASDGCRIVLAPDAWIEERVGPERARLGWLVRRAFREGTIDGRRARQRGGALVAMLARNAGKAALGVAEAARGVLRRSIPDVVHGLWRTIAAAGSIYGRCGGTYEQYRPGRRAT